VSWKIYRRLLSIVIVEEESDETAYWFELLIEANIVADSFVAELSRSNEIVAMTVASIKTLRART
jgi:uncharacterized membrane-anchored protein